MTLPEVGIIGLKKPLNLQPPSYRVNAYQFIDGRRLHGVKMSKGKIIRKGNLRLKDLKGRDGKPNIKVDIKREACSEYEIIGLPHYKPTDKIEHFDYKQKIGGKFKIGVPAPIKFEPEIPGNPKSNAPIPTIRIRHGSQYRERSIKLNKSIKLHRDKSIKFVDLLDKVAMISSSYPTSAHPDGIIDVKLTCDENMNFELFINEVSEGTCTDSTEIST